MARYRRYAFPSARRWQDMREMRSRVTGSGKISPRCVPRRSTMAKCSRSAPPPSIWRWRDCALMRPWPDWQWQYSRAVRSRASIRGKFCAPCIPKAASDGKIASSRQDSRAMHPKTGWLWQDMRAMHPKSPANRLSGTHRAKILPGRGRLSLHGPLESRTARESCHRSAHERKGSGRKCLRFVKTEPKRQKMSPKVLTSF